MRRSREEIENEKKENFIRLAEARTQKTIELIRLIGNLANTSNYSYTSEQVDKVFGAILRELIEAYGSYEHEQEDEKTIFKL